MSFERHPEEDREGITAYLCKDCRMYRMVAKDAPNKAYLSECDCEILARHNAAGLNAHERRVDLTHVGMCIARPISGIVVAVDRVDGLAMISPPRDCVLHPDVPRWVDVCELLPYAPGPAWRETLK